MLKIWDFDETYIQLTFEDQWVLEELADYFTFEIPNAQMNPLVKYGKWDGKIRLFRRANNTIYKGLLSHVLEFCKDRQIDFDVDASFAEELKANRDFNGASYISTLGIKGISPYDYQIETVETCIRAKRKLVISPTSSGKSLLMYCILRYLETNTDGKILLIVPNVDLVGQLAQEFEDYSDYDLCSNIHQIYEGQPKNAKKKIYISTWQSLQDEKKPYFQQFTAILCDEAHTMTADTIKGIYEKSVNCQYRYGFTGTIKDTATHRLILEGLTGKMHVVTTTKELMDRGIVADLSIECIAMKYDEATSKKMSKMEWHEEQKFIVNHPKRNEFIAKLATSIKNENVLILTQYVEHVQILKNLLQKSGKDVFVITGDVKKDERALSKKFAENNTNVIFICTFGVFSTGQNVKNLQHMIFATCGKASIKIKQSIGRVLRLDGKDNTATVWDLVDDGSHSGKKNISLKHFYERVKIYSDQKFKFKITKMKL